MIQATAHLMVCNEEYWIEKVLKAILSAPFDQILFYDCGSADKTLGIAQGFTDPRLIIKAMGKLSPEQNGAVRQVMLNETKTPWAYQVDGDELYPPGMLDRILAVELPGPIRTGLILLHEIDKTDQGLRIVSQTSGHRLHHKTSRWQASYPFETTQWLGEDGRRFYFPPVLYGYHVHALPRSPLDGQTYFRKQKQRLAKHYLDLEIPDGALFE